MRTKIIMLVSALILSGCSTYGKASFPSDLLAECKPVIVLESGDRASVMKNITANAFNQQECIDRHKALAEAARATSK